jgi:predicted acyltransferase
MAGMVGVVGLLYCLYIADAAGAFRSWTWITSVVSVGSALGSHAALTASGAVLGMALAPGSPLSPAASRARWALWHGLGLAVAGTLLHAARDVHPMFEINKIRATPPWCLWSAAITTWMWALLDSIMRWRPDNRWSNALVSAGQNPLLAYLLAPLIYAALEIASSDLGGPSFYEALGGSFSLGVARSVAFAILVTWMAGRVLRAGVVLRL